MHFLFISCFYAPNKIPTLTKHIIYISRFKNILVSVLVCPKIENSF